jgi:hypothetical protein
MKHFRKKVVNQQKSKIMREITLIVKKDGKKFWTDSYIEKDGFLEFEIKDKTGKRLAKMKLNKDSIDEITLQTLKDKQA